MNPTTASTSSLPTAPARSTITVPLRLDPETRSTDGQLRLSGLAIPYEAMSDDLGFFEVIERGAFRSSIADGATDVMLLWMHDHAQPLARQSAGNLEVRETPEGVRFAATLPNTTLARDAVELARTGVVKQMSFGFVALSDKWEQRNGEKVRVVTRARLHEVSLVGEPAYSQTSAEARNRELAERIERTVSRMRRPSGTPSPYLPTGEHSWFRDQWVLAQQHAATSALIDAGHGPAFRGTQPFGFPHPLHGGTEEARARLDQLGRHLRETRDLTTTATAGGNFAGAPQHVADAFSAAVRARGVLPGVFPVADLPERGMSIKTPRVTTGPATEVQAVENVAASEVDLVEANVSSPVSTVTGFTELSQQLLDRAEPGMDSVIGTELGRGIAEDLDVLLLTGSGTAPYLRGLDNVTGLTSTAYTDASPTQAEAWGKIVTCAAAVATALGSEPTHVLMHSRRDAWIFGSSWASAPLVLPYGMAHVACNAISTTSGAGTNEDRVYVLRADELPVYLGPVQTRVHVDYSGSGTLTARIVAYQYASALFARRPEAVGVVSGTGLAGVTF